MIKFNKIQENNKRMLALEHINITGKHLDAYTDYPFYKLGDKPFNKAPVRPIRVISYDDNKYCQIIVNGIKEEIKAGYVYLNRR